MKIFMAWPPRTPPQSLDVTMQAELEEELRQAEQDFARGDFIELTVQELDGASRRECGRGRTHPPSKHHLSDFDSVREHQA